MSLRRPVLRYLIAWPIRLTLSVTVLAFLCLDHSARLTRVYLATLPDADVVADVRTLIKRGEYDEAEYLLERAIERAPEAAVPRLRAEQAALEQERSSVTRRAEAMFKSAVTGDAQSAEGLATVIVTDFFVIGDIRDLIQEGTKQVVDGESDEVIIALSTLGVGTTVGGPVVDAMLSLMKGIAKKVKLAPELGKWLVNAVRNRQSDELAQVMLRGAEAMRITDARALTRLIGKCANEKELASLFDKTIELGRIGGARDTAAAMRHVESPKQLQHLIDFTRRRPDKLGVVGLGGRESVRALERFGSSVDDLVIQLARKGDAGRAWMRVGPTRLLRPHPLLGLAKGIHKGTFERAAQRLVESVLDPFGGWLIAIFLGWSLIECGMLARRTYMRYGAATRPTSDHRE